MARNEILIQESTELVERVTHADELLAIIVSHRFREHGVHFFTDEKLSQQLAYMRHPIGKRIDPHIHNPVARKVDYTQEVLVIRQGKLRIDFFSTQQDYLESRILQSGDVILLVSGGHGFEMLEETEIIEVKQGPYLGEKDKIRFSKKSG